MDKRIFSAREINQLISHGHDPFSSQIQASASIPVEYITGYAEFYGRDFIVTQDTLIPRIETELIIDLVFKEEVTKTNQFVHILDIATGSGCIGITVWLELQKRGIDGEVILSDIQEEALAVAKQNIRKYTIPESQVKIIQSSLFDAIPKKSYQLIVANLPYIPSGRINHLEPSVKNFEPRSALDGGEDGLFLITKTLQQIPEYLASDGVAFFEVDDTHSQEVANRHQPKHFLITVHKDENRKNRVWEVRKNKQYF